jgi:hypothetical protein
MHHPLKTKTYTVAKSMLYWVKSFLIAVIPALLGPSAKLSLCIIKHHATKIYGGLEIRLQVFLISGLDGGG